MILVRAKILLSRTQNTDSLDVVSALEERDWCY